MKHVKNYFFYVFATVLIISFLAHYKILNNLNVPITKSKIIETYIINVFIVIAFFLLIKFFLPKIKAQLGFIFIGFSLIKFVLFFILIHPTYNIDLKMSVMEFASFFIPYFICLAGEVLILSKLLNNLKF